MSFFRGLERCDRISTSSTSIDKFDDKDVERSWWWTASFRKEVTDDHTDDVGPQADPNAVEDVTDDVTFDDQTTEGEQIGGADFASISVSGIAIPNGTLSTFNQGGDQYSGTASDNRGRLGPPNK